MKVILEEKKVVTRNLLQNKLFTLKNQVKQNFAVQKEIKKALHKILCLEHKNTLLLLDIAVVVIVLMNLTNIVLMESLTSERTYEEVAQKGKVVTYQELNPVMVKLHGYEQTTRLETIKMFFAMVKQSMIWLVIICFYVYYRSIIYKPSHLFFIFCGIMYYMLLISNDFLLNLGKFVGRWMYLKC